MALHYHYDDIMTGFLILGAACCKSAKQRLQAKRLLIGGKTASKTCVSSGLSNGVTEASVPGTSY